MKTDLVRIGNSRGIRIPKPLIEQLGFGEAVDLRVENKSLIISPAGVPREGWAEKFRGASAGMDDELLLTAAANEFDVEEWEW